jgi:hypothetical protein
MDDVNSEMQNAELELRQILRSSPGAAASGILQAYNRRSLEEREAFVSVLAARIAVAEVASHRHDRLEHDQHG